MSLGNFTNNFRLKGKSNYIKGLVSPSWFGSILAGGYKVCVSRLSKCDILVCPLSPPLSLTYSQIIYLPRQPGRARENKFFFPILISATPTLPSTPSPPTSSINFSIATFRKSPTLSKHQESPWCSVCDWLVVFSSPRGAVNIYILTLIHTL